ncbi:MAG: hypothetical protein NTV30_00365 [Chloroflexi bacterium]|nr:hypothetical protein [Chloroflexota bacterium]
MSDHRDHGDFRCTAELSITGDGNHRDLFRLRGTVVRISTLQPVAIQNIFLQMQAGNTGNYYPGLDINDPRMNRTNVDAFDLEPWVQQEVTEYPIRARARFTLPDGSIVDIPTTTELHIDHPYQE